MRLERDGWLEWRCRQSNANSSPLGESPLSPYCTSGRARPPLGQCGRAAFFVSLSIGEVAFLVEVVVDVSKDRGELL